MIKNHTLFKTVPIFLFLILVNADLYEDMKVI